MNEERMRILRMVSEGKLTPEQAAELLAALDARSGPGPSNDENGPAGATGGRRKRPRWLRVRVTDTQTGQVRVNVNVPFKLVEVGSKLGARWMPDELGGVNISELLEAATSGEDGKIVEVTDEESGEHVVVYVE